jgi:hypothetical protein
MPKAGKPSASATMNVPNIAPSAALTAPQTDGRTTLPHTAPPARQQTMPIDVPMSMQKRVFIFRKC